jgi:hypothetical protein
MVDVGRNCPVVQRSSTRLSQRMEDRRIDRRFGNPPNALSPPPRRDGDPLVVVMMVQR